MQNEDKVVKGYHDLLRPEILDLIPKSSKRILDIGCGTGKLGGALKKRQECTVNGIESHEAAAEEAKKAIDNVYVHDLDIPRAPKYGKKYDCIVLADILEHLQNPWGVLLNECKNLSPDGTIVASIPNIAHPGIISELNEGLWRYTPAGILDITHLRFFTKTSICQMFLAAGLKIEHIEATPSSVNPMQYLVVAKLKKSQEQQPVVTLIMLTLNAWSYTRWAIESIEKHTKVPYRLIVVDNGSRDQTVGYLRDKDKLQHIENSKNLGFAKGFNLGLNFVDTPYFAILNNDIIVTEGWLTRLLNGIKSEEKIGLIGPRSNYVSGPQFDPNAKYSNLEGMHAYAKTLSDACKTAPRLFPRIVFFCTLFKSELLQKVGLLDEQFGLGNFEDDDYCKRVAKAGYKCAIDDGTFIHHYGSTTFKANNIDYAKSMERNQDLFNRKWGIK